MIEEKIEDTIDFAHHKCGQKCRNMDGQSNQHVDFLVNCKSQACFVWWHASAQSLLIMHLFPCRCVLSMMKQLRKNNDFCLMCVNSVCQAR